MNTPSDPPRVTRMLFLGDDRLADGFRLIGFETYPNPTHDEVERVLRTLVRDRQRAFVIVDDALMAADLPWLRRVRREGGRIVITAVPRLTDPPRLRSDVADRVDTMFGGATLSR